MEIRRESFASETAVALADALEAELLAGSGPISRSGSCANDSKSVCCEKWLS